MVLFVRRSRNCWLTISRRRSDFSAALAYWIAAGDAAEQHGANQEAVAHFRSAKQLTERADLSAADRARTP